MIIMTIITKITMMIMIREVVVIVGALINKMMRIAIIMTVTSVLVYELQEYAVSVTVHSCGFYLCYAVSDSVVNKPFLNSID